MNSISQRLFTGNLWEVTLSLVRLANALLLLVLVSWSCTLVHLFKWTRIQSKMSKETRNLHRASLFFCCKQPVKNFQGHLSSVVATKGAFSPPTVLEWDQSFGFTFNAIFDWSLRSPQGESIWPLVAASANEQDAFDHVISWTIFM